MKAVVKTKKGIGLSLLDVPTPEIKDTEVLIKVEAASICGSDLPIYNWDDSWTVSTVMPGLIPGHEFAGVISKVGKLVTGLNVGDRVCVEGHLFCGECKFCHSGQSHICEKVELVGFSRNGAFTEYIAIPSKNVIKTPNLPSLIGSLMDPFGNAVHACSKADLSNANIVILGCGPIGLMVILLAQRLGARNIISVDISEYRLQLAQKIGANFVVNSSDQSSKKKILDFCPDGIDILFEMSGSEKAIEQNLSLINSGGLGIFLGLPKHKVTLDIANDFVAKGITFHGIIGRQIFQTWEQSIRFVDPAINPNPLGLEQIITHQLPLEEFEKGFDLMNSRKCGKVVLLP
jgi:threonine 3-dehydrogenase